MIEYPNRGIVINDNGGTVATIESDNYLLTVNNYLPDIEMILDHFTKKMDKELADGLEHAHEILNDYDAAVAFIKERDRRWYKNHRKNTKEWNAWNTDRIFNEDKWFWQPARKLGEEPTPRLYMSKTTLSDKIDVLKYMLETRYVQRYENYRNDDINDVLVRELAHKFFQHSTERTKEDAQSHLYFLEEVRDTVLAANYSTIYVQQQAMLRLATIEKFIEVKLEEIEGKNNVI